MALLTDGKLFANGFLSDLAPLCFTPTGNCSPGDFSTPLEMTGAAGRHGASYRQETIREWFPTRHDAFVFHAGRKRFANGFPLDMTPLCVMPTGNGLRMVSCPT